MKSGDVIGASITFAILVAFSFLAYAAIQNDEDNKEKADKICGPFKQVTWFHDDAGKIRSVCKNVDDNYVVKP